MSNRRRGDSGSTVTWICCLIPIDGLGNYRREFPDRSPWYRRAHGSILPVPTFLPVPYHESNRAVSQRPQRTRSPCARRAPSSSLAHLPQDRRRPLTSGHNACSPRYSSVHPRAIVALSGRPRVASVSHSSCETKRYSSCRYAPTHQPVRSTTMLSATTRTVASRGSAGPRTLAPRPATSVR